MGDVTLYTVSGVNPNSETVTSWSGKTKTTSLKRLKCSVGLILSVCHDKQLLPRTHSCMIHCSCTDIDYSSLEVSSVTSGTCESFKTLTAIDLDVLWLYNILSATCGGSDWKHTAVCLHASTDDALWRLAPFFTKQTNTLHEADPSGSLHSLVVSCHWFPLRLGSRRPLLWPAGCSLVPFKWCDELSDEALK